MVKRPESAAIPMASPRGTPIRQTEKQMATLDLTVDSFEQTILDNDIVLVDFWAEWCGPCRMFAPWYEEVSAEHEDVVFGKVDTEQEQALAATFNIRSIPTLMAFRDDVLVFSQPGALPKQALHELVGQIRELDMDDVRRKIAEHEGAEHEGADHSH
jgi:thioredoxin 1